MWIFYFNTNDKIQFSSVQSLSRVRLFATPWIAARQASLSITNSQSSLRLSRPLSQWCHPAISSSVVPFSSCPQSLPASESFPMNQLFEWGGQSTGVLALASFIEITAKWFSNYSLVLFRTTLERSFTWNDNDSDKITVFNKWSAILFSFSVFSIMDTLL